ncbi:hypothetical protein [Acinetobacter sp. YH01021]|uniref:hypothetical protein n=1 Tax=Acinetobacter sp. YH01021 TaxID=2601035 RepID=UPI0015D2C2A3|nr:hypothetical protein [Acinetobacter sp. YH01021]
MDIQKEREDFEAYIISKHKIRSPLVLTQRIQHGFTENYIVQGVQDCWETWKEAKAQAVPEGFVLVPKDSLKVALSWMNEDLDPWQMGGDSFAELYKHKPILETLIEAQEPANDSANN